MIPRIIKFLEYNPFPPDSDLNYPIYVRTFGDHISKKRLDDGITQKCLAKQLGVSVDAIRDWEKGRTKPCEDYKLKIIGFLNYDPFDKEPATAPFSHTRQEEHRSTQRIIFSAFEMLELSPY